MTIQPIVVIGIGPDGSDLSREALEHIARAQLLAGGRRNLDCFLDWQGERLEIDADLPRVIARLKEFSGQGRCVVLASGDPLFFGIGRVLLENFPRESLMFLPHVSSVQIAFARLKMPWDDARVMSLHGRPMDLLRPALVEGRAKIALLTDAKNHPAAIARFLLDEGFGDTYQIWVGENLSSPAERCTLWSPGEIENERFSPLNVVVLIRTAKTLSSGHAPLLGLPDDLLTHRDGQITRWEVRLIALGLLELQPGNVLWDIGAGSGSLSIEAARLCPSLSAWAIEKNTEACRHIRENLGKLAIANVRVVHGEAPAALAELPAPAAVFIGGNGGRLTDILETAMDRLQAGGRLVMNCVALDSLTMAWNWFGERHLTPAVTSVQLARSRPLGSLSCLEPEKPIFILRVKRGDRFVTGPNVADRLQTGPHLE